MLGRDASTPGAAGEGPVRRSWIPLPEGKPIARGDGLALSPDGSVLVLSAGLDEQSLLYVRRLDSFDLEALPGTEGAASPFFSPDGEQVGFFADDQLKKVSLRGGGRDVTTLCDAPVGSGGTWDASGWIYFLFGESRLARVRDKGGEPEELGEAGDVVHVRALPDSRGILLTTKGSSTSIRKDTAKIAVLLPDGKTIRPLVDGGYSARYLSTGQLVFMRLTIDPLNYEGIMVRTSSDWGETWSEEKCVIGPEGLSSYNLGVFARAFQHLESSGAMLILVDSVSEGETATIAYGFFDYATLSFTEYGRESGPEWSPAYLGLGAYLTDDSVLMVAWGQYPTGGYATLYFTTSVDTGLTRDMFALHVDVARLQGSLLASSVRLAFEAPSDGTLHATIQNAGLSFVSLAVYDQSGDLVRIAHVVVKMRSSDSYPGGTFEVDLCGVTGGQQYLVLPLFSIRSIIGAAILPLLGIASRTIAEKEGG